MAKKLRAKASQAKQTAATGKKKRGAASAEKRKAATKKGRAAPTASKRKTAKKKRTRQPTSVKRTTRKTVKARKETAVAAPIIERTIVAEPQQGPYVDRGQPLPAGFSDDRLVALVRDPNWLFLYWELQGERANTLVAERGGGKGFLELPWALRLSSDDPQLNRDIPVNVAAGNHYLEVGRQQRLRIEIGFYDTEGAFVSVASTNDVDTVRDTSAPDYEDSWMSRPLRIVRGKKAYTMRPAAIPRGIRQATVELPSSYLSSLAARRKK